MKSKIVTRYYCDHCGKGMMVKSAMMRHENRCVHNSNRHCGHCRIAELEQKPISDLLSAIVDGGLEKLREVSGSCPSCMLSAVIKWNRVEINNYDGGDDKIDYISFDYKKEHECFWKEYRAEPQSRLC
jgi:hypothetical protein